MLGYVQYKEMQRRTAERLKISKEHEWSKHHYKEDRVATLRHHDRMAHNMQFHMECMSALPTIEDVRKYSERVLDLKDFKMKITGNNDVDCILWPKQQRAEEKRIAFNVTGTLPERMGFLDRVDIVTIFGNALANAIDACEKIETGEKFINVVVRLDKHLDIRIDNPFAEAPVVQRSGRLKSTKKDPGHGLGMESIHEAVRRYDGHIDTVIEDGVFSLRIMLQQITPPELTGTDSRSQEEKRLADMVSDFNVNVENTAGEKDGDDSICLR
jgi:hypothetical protein